MKKKRVLEIVGKVVDGVDKVEKIIGKQVERFRKNEVVRDKIADFFYLKKTKVKK